MVVSEFKHNGDHRVFKFFQPQLGVRYLAHQPIFLELRFAEAQSESVLFVFQLLNRLLRIDQRFVDRHVDVELSLDSGVLTLEIRDNGRGMGPNDLAKERSFGIRGLHERAATVGGWVDLSSSARGTSLILSVPLEAGVSLLDDEDVSPATHDPSAWGSA